MYELRKSLGQHFLTDDNICRRIVQSLDTEQFTQLLEIGPGGGALTRYLRELPQVDFKAIEIDREKVAYLLATYPDLAGKLLQESFLESRPPFEGTFSVIGNFPYNISTQILFKILEWREQVPVVLGMFQKEVAQRIAAAPGNKIYGVTSVLVQAFYRVSYLFDVPPQAFHPPPKVESGVIKMHRNAEIPDMKSERAFFTLVKTAFNQRRKTLRNATRSLFSAEQLSDPIFDLRAERLTVADFAALTFKMN